MNQQIGETPFSPDPALAAETLASADLPLGRVLLRDERRFPWLILVPRVPGAVETFDLPAETRARLWSEVDTLAQALRTETAAFKINIAAFGNVVRQLHVHVVARREDDPAWPAPAVGWAPPAPYAEGAVPSFWPALLRRLSLTPLT